jgi:hypothetical protein
MSEGRRRSTDIGGAVDLALEEVAWLTDRLRHTGT